ncbi:MAG TPA: ATP-binding protein, partial [Thermoanaerobaculia bacterium]|nr:ATP-binding protein [Thermoanaerobaculia bacterium]
NSVASTLTLALAVMGFALANLFVSRGLPERFAATRTMTTFLAGVAIAALAVPTRRGVGAALERIHYRGSFGRRRVLAELGRELLHERDLDALCATLLDHLEMALELPQVNLYLAQKGGSLVAVRPAARLPRELPASLLGEDQWAAEIHAISGFAAPGEDDNPGLELFRAGFRYAFPLTVRGHQVGVLVTGYKLDETPLNSEDIELARQTLNQAAVAIENAQLLDRLHHQLEEVLRLERYTEGIIQSSPAGLAVLDTDGCILSANLAFAAIAGRERRHLLGRPLAEALPIHLPQPGSGLEAQVIEDAAGSEHHLQLSLAQLEGEASGQRILVVQDVSDRVRLENELREKDRLASLGMLAAGVAHEVNTPITGISSYAQLLLDETPEDDPRHGLLKKVERQTFRASQIVRSLLDFARQRRGEQRLVSIGGVLSAAVDELRDRATERGVEVHWQPAGERFLVFGSETELTQVLVNLMTNALDAMKTGGTLTLAVEGDEQRVRASVTDTGSGIPREQIERIFQPFFSTKLSEGGTGLGLSISYEIVRRHGGLMTVASEPGQGSRFCVELPRRHEAQTPPATS